MSLKNTILISDLDGTLLSHNKALPDEYISAIEKFRQAGGLFTIATGRPIQSTMRYIVSLKPDLPIVLYNGTMLYDVNSDKIIWEKYLPDCAYEYAKTVLDNFPDIGAEIFTFDAIFAPRTNKVEKDHQELIKVEVDKRSFDDIPKSSWCKALFADEPEKIAEVIKFISESNFTGVDFVSSSSIFYEMLPPDASKGEALKMLKKIYSLQNSKVCAFGDFDNDISMLNESDLAFAPQNAIPGVKSAADIVTSKSCDENAIAEVIEYIIKDGI